MTRRSVLTTCALLAAAGLTARPARAEGLIRFHNRSFSGGVTVEVRVGATLESAALYGTRQLAKDEDWEVDTGGATAWWRREQNPGRHDGLFTALSLVDASRSDVRVEL